MRMLQDVTLAVLLSAAVAGSMSGRDARAEYPDRPIRLIVPMAPGGQPDINARMFAGALGEQMRQQLVVDNRPGASSSIGYEMVARAPADGYTIGYGATTLATNPSVLPKVSYDVRKDFQMVILTNITPNIMTVSPSLPVTSVSELIEYAKRNPGKLMFGSSGNGTSMHLSMELFKIMSGAPLVHIPYKAIQQVHTEIAGGRLHVVSDNVASVLPHINAGRLRGLGVTSARRIPATPHLPTIAEAGVPGFETTAWGGYIVPAGTPRAIVEKLNIELNRVVTSPAIRERWVAMGIEPVGGTAEHFTAHVKKEIAKWTDVVQRAGIKPD